MPQPSSRLSFLNRFVLVYLDDILIFSQSPEEQRQHVRVVLLEASEEQAFYESREVQFPCQESQLPGVHH